jgi:hypothetical protein
MVPADIIDLAEKQEGVYNLFSDYLVGAFVEDGSILQFLIQPVISIPILISWEIFLLILK